VTNPLVNYPKGEWYSKLVLERAPDAKAPHKGMWQTQHLFGDNSHVIAVLEDAVVVLPSQHGNLWDDIALTFADVEGGAGGGAGAAPAAHK
jgi:hypothetical protein